MSTKSEVLPEKSVKRLTKVLVRCVHLVGVAGVFGCAMTQTTASVYFSMVIWSGIALVVMEAYSGWLWFVQLRGVAVSLKLMILVLLHLYPAASIPCLVAVIVISGFMSHAPAWIRYYSLVHGQEIHTNNDIAG